MASVVIMTGLDIRGMIAYIRCGAWENEMAEGPRIERLDVGAALAKKDEKEGKKEQKRLAKKYFHPFVQEADLKLAALPVATGLKRGEESAVVRAMLRGKDGMERNALMDILCLYQFAGLSHREIAKRTEMTPRLIRALVLDPRFAMVYGEFRKERIGKIGDAIGERVSEVMQEALEVKIDMLRQSKSEWLKNTIANELLQMGKEFTHGKGSVLSEELKGIWQRAIRKNLPDGTTVTETRTVTGMITPGTVDTAIDVVPEDFSTQDIPALPDGDE